MFTTKILFFPYGINISFDIKVFVLEKLSNFDRHGYSLFLSERVWLYICALSGFSLSRLHFLAKLLVLEEKMTEEGVISKRVCFKTVFLWNLFFSFRLITTNLPLTKDSEDKANSGFCLFLCGWRLSVSLC